MTLLRHDLFLLCVLATKIGRLVQNLYCAAKLSMSVYGVQIWEFIKENKKVRKQENTLSTKKATKKKRKKNDNGNEKKKENTLLTKKVRFKKSP